MDARVKKMWVKALRSGEYKKREHFMKRAGKHCCLGVLQECAIKDGLEFDPNWTNGLFLPYEVTKWSKLRGTDMDSLADMNDSGCDFHQIAACIENGL